ncbi:MAG: AAA family ATPase [Vescimonas sp.]
MLAGSPKVGKSFHEWPSLPIGSAPAHRSGVIPSVKGTVLYLALEDDYRRLQERSYRMFGTAENESLFFSVSAGQLGSGLDEQLTNFLREHPGTSLIIIDTLQKVRGVDRDNYPATPTIIRSSLG